MASSLYPAFFQVHYHSSYGVHVQTVPTQAFTPNAGDGTFLNWNGTQINAAEMITDFVDLEAPFYPDTVEFDYATIFTMTAPDSAVLPRQNVSLTAVGSNAAPGWTKALQATWNLKTDLGGDFKIVMLDAGNNNSWDPVNFAGLSMGSVAFLDFLTDGDNAFAGRDNGKPEFFLHITYDLNDKLRAEYHMN